MTTTRKFKRARPYKLSASNVRAVVRHRDGYRCTECGMTSRQHHKKYGKALEVHRLVPGSRYTVKGSVTLCRKCHGPKPKSVHGAVGGSRSGQRAIMFYLPKALNDLLRQYVAKTRVSVSAAVRLALEQLFEAEGLWPPKADED